MTKIFIIMAYIVMCNIGYAQNNSLKQTISSSPNTSNTLYYTYTDAENEGFIGHVRQVTTTSDIKCLDFNIDKESTIEFDRNGNYILYRISSNGRPKVKYNDILFPKRLLEGRIYNIPNVWGGYVSGDFSIAQPLIPLASPIVCTNGVTEYFYKNGRLDYIDILGQLKYEYKYNDKGGLISRSENGKPYIRIDCTGLLLNNTYQYDDKGKEIDKASFTVSDNIMTIKERYYYEASSFTFDNAGRIININGRTGSSINAPKFTRNFTYHNGYIIKEIYQDNTNTIINELKYDKKGNVIRFVNNGIIYIFKYAYNGKGDWIRRSCYKILSGDIDIETEVFTQYREIDYYL